MQGKLQETFGWSTLNQLETVKQVLERVSSLDQFESFDFLPSASISAGMSHLLNDSANPELEHRSQRVSEKFSENIQLIANEPSVAFFRIQEHIRNTVPQLVDNKHEVQSLQNRVQGSYFDTEYAIKAVAAMEGSQKHFQSIRDLIKNSMFMKQQIKYEKERRKNRSAMMRTQTLDASLGPSERQRRAEFTQSVQLPTTTSLQQFEDQPRARSSSFTSQEKPAQ